MIKANEGQKQWRRLASPSGTRHSSILTFTEGIFGTTCWSWQCGTSLGLQRRTASLWERYRTLQLLSDCCYTFRWTSRGEKKDSLWSRWWFFYKDTIKLIWYLSGSKTIQIQLSCRKHTTDSTMLLVIQKGKAKLVKLYLKIPFYYSQTYRTSKSSQMSWTPGRLRVIFSHRKLDNWHLHLRLKVNSEHLKPKFHF